RRQRQLRNDAILPDHRQPAGAEECSGGGPHDDAVIVGTVRNSVTPPGQVRQPHDTAVERPGERLAPAGAYRAADCNVSMRHAESLRSGVTNLHNTDVINL